MRIEYTITKSAFVGGVRVAVYYPIEGYVAYISHALVLLPLVCPGFPYSSRERVPYGACISHALIFFPSVAPGFPCSNREGEIYGACLLSTTIKIFLPVALELPCTTG